MYGITIVILGSILVVVLIRTMLLMIDVDSHLLLACVLVLPPFVYLYCIYL